MRKALIAEHYNSNAEAFRRLGSPGEVIQDQNGRLSGSMIMGVRKGDWNGCGWIAAYNVLTLLGDKISPAEIIREYEKRGLIFRGFFGVAPGAFKRLMKARGFNVKRYFSFKKGVLAMTNNNAAVFWGRQRKRMNFHFFAARKADDGSALMYNMGIQTLKNIKDAGKYFRIYLTYIVEPTEAEC